MIIEGKCKNKMQMDQNIMSVIEIDYTLICEPSRLGLLKVNLGKKGKEVKLRTKREYANIFQSKATK